MSHTSDIESSSNPDGLQEIRSWASRSRDAARPGFRTRPGGVRYSPRIAASIGFALLLFLALTGYRSLQIEQNTPAPPPASQPERVASVAPVAVEEAPPPVEAVAERSQTPGEPMPVPATLPARPAPEERSREDAAVLRPEPDAEEPKASLAILVSRDAFESEPAVLLSTPAADYPEAARGTGTSARIIVGFTVDETGAVRNPVIESTWIQGDAPKAPFEQAALTAVLSARFTPARERGLPARSWSTLTFSFETGASPAGI